ncbi:MAG: protein kinase [Planctomycetales bacterium]|nr:protein kinase [Planctomycetales bacterium]
MDGNQSRCIRCGQPLDTSVAGDQCLVCLLRVAAEDDSFDDSFAEPEIEQQGAPRHIGDYELESEIARGGMGAVFRARQVSLNRTVAIKMMIAGQLATPDLVRRFQTEAEAAAMLDHPNIVPIYEVGEAETLHFYSMKLIEGENLSECSDSLSLSRPLTPAQVRERERRIAGLMIKVANALSYAHGRGVLHRDIKPSNILIDAGGEPHLTDFGLAKLSENVGSRLTMTSSVMGSPSYMSPEQAVGDTHGITTQADIYSFGAVLYELLTGRPPFTGKTAIETIRQVVDQTPPKPRSLNSKIHPDLETIAMRCLEKVPHQRYASAADVGLELRRFVKGESIVARPVGPMQELWRWANRNRRVAATAALLLLALLIGTAGIAWQSRRATIANEELSKTVSYLQWTRLTDVVQRGEIREAVAHLAAILRRDPSNRQAASYAMSILDQSRYHVPAGAHIAHPDDAVITVAQFSSDEKLLATGSADRSVRIWNCDDSTLAITPIVLNSKIENLSFNHDGTLLAVSTSGKKLSVRRVRDGAEVFAESYEDPVSNLSFARQSQELVYSVGSTLWLWRPDSDPAIRKSALKKRIQSVSLSDDGSRAATLFADRTLSVWETDSGTELFQENKFSVLDAVISGDGKRIAASEKDFGSLVIWDIESGQEICSTNTSFGDVNELTFVANDRRIVVASTTHHWSATYDCLTGQQCGPLMKHQTRVNVVEPFAAGQSVMTLSKKNELRFWNVETGEPYAEPVTLPGGIIHAGVSRSGNIIWTGVTDLRDSIDIRSVQIWRLHNPRVPPDLSQSPERFLSAAAAASSDGRWVVSCIGRRGNSGKGVQAELTFVEAPTGRAVRSPFVLDSDALACTFTPDNQKLVTVTVKGQITVFSVPDFQPILGPFDSGHPIQPSRLSPDGRYLATGSRDGLVTVWDLNTLQPVWKQQHSKARLNDLCFSKDSRILTSCSNDGTGKVWDTSSGSLVSELVGHQDRIYHIRIDSTQQLIATGGDDNDVIVWELQSGKTLFRLPQVDRIYSIAFHPTQDILAVASRDGRCQLFSAKTGEPIGRPMVFGQVVYDMQFSSDGSRLLCAGQSGFQLWNPSVQRPLTVLHRQLGQYASGVDADGLRARFIQNDNAVLCGALRYSSRIWSLKKLQGSVPNWFPDLLESIVMQRINLETEVLELVEFDFQAKTEQRILSQKRSDYVAWCEQWFADSSISNHSVSIDDSERTHNELD